MAQLTLGSNGKFYAISDDGMIDASDNVGPQIDDKFLLKFDDRKLVIKHLPNGLTLSLVQHDNDIRRRANYVVIQTQQDNVISMRFPVE